MKKVLAIVISVLMLVGIVPVFSSAAEIVDSGSCGAQGENLTWTLNNEGLLLIRGSGVMQNYSDLNETVSAPWHRYRQSIRTILIEQGTTSIGDYAFDECTEATNITIPTSVTQIGDSVFRRCTGLASIDIPNSVISIGRCAFYACTGLVNAVLSDNMTSIPELMFFGCAFTSITIPNSVTSIGDAAFGECRKLNSIVIPDSVTIIEQCAFERCVNLTTVSIPNSITSIGIGAFDDCTNLSDVYYSGTIEQWNAIAINEEGNSALLAANIHFNTGGDFPETDEPNNPSGNNQSFFSKLIAFFRNIIAFFGRLFGRV